MKLINAGTIVKQSVPRANSSYRAASLFTIKI